MAPLRRVVARLLLTAPFGCAAATAWGAQPAQPTTSAPRSEPARPAGSSTLSSLASQLQQLQPSTPAWVVVGPVETSARPEPEPEQLARLHERLRATVGSTVVPLQALASQALDRAEARAQARSQGRTLLYLAPRIDGGSLIVSADLVAWSGSFWQRARSPEGISQGHAVLTAPIDAEVRSYLPRPRGWFQRRVSVPAPLPDTQALACGEDERGELTLWLVGRRELVVGRFAEGRFELGARRDWGELSPIAPAPLRAPSTVAVPQDGVVWIGSSDRARAVAVGSDLAPRWSGPRGWPLSAELCAPFTPTGVGPSATPCAARPVTSAAGTDSAALRLESSLAGVDGIVVRYALWLPAAGGPLRIDVRSPIGADARWNLDTGGALALEDLDGDGRAELLSSAPVDEAARDVLRVHTLAPEGPVSRVELPLPHIRAIAVCPFEGENPLTVVVASADRLWVLT